VKSKFILGFVSLAFTVTACGGPEELSGADMTGGVQQNLGGDVTAPVSTIIVDKEQQPDGSYQGNVSVEITATDDMSGVANIYWARSGMYNDSGSITGADGWLPIISRVGTTKVTYYAKDAAGNVEASRSLDIVVTPSGWTCRDVILNEFNYYLAADYSGGHDVRGKVAAGGNIDMHYFAVGAELAEGDIQKVLVAGKSLTLSDGGVFGNAAYGTSANVASTTTFYRGALSQGAPVNFAQQTQDMKDISGLLSTATVNGTADFQSWGGLFLTGTSPSVNIFRITTTTLAATKYFSISVPQDSIAVINVTGTTSTVGGFSNNYSGVDATGVLFNFTTATSLTVSGYGFFGTVLAPKANVNYNNGSIDGAIYANSLTGNVEGHIAKLRPFKACGIWVGQ
jgi:choice-of-anchor A domain-containing protein